MVWKINPSKFRSSCILKESKLQQLSCKVSNWISSLVKVPVQNNQYKINSFIFFSDENSSPKIQTFEYISTWENFVLSTIFVVFNLETSQTGENKR